MTRLSGRVVAITRDGTPEDPLRRKLQDEGARVVDWPTLAFGPPDHPLALERARARLLAGGYRWVVFTSARAVPSVADAGAPPASTRVAAVGRATARAVRAAGWPVHVTGNKDARALAQAMAEAGDLEGARVLFPAASRAGDALEEGLAGDGARVERVEAYETRLVPPDPDVVRRDLRAGVDVVTFASPSAVASLSGALGGDWPGALAGIGCAAIGPTTEAALVEAGVAPDRIATAAPPSLDGLVEASVQLINRRREGSWTESRRA